MKKQIYLLLVPLSLGLSYDAQAALYNTARQAAPLISRYAVRPGGLPQGMLTTPAMRTFASPSTRNLAPKLAQPNSWQQTLGAMNSSSAAQWPASRMLSTPCAQTNRFFDVIDSKKNIAEIRNAIKHELQHKTEILHRAIQANDLYEVKKAIDTGADVNGRDSDGSTPLINAASNGNLEIVQLLIAKRADIQKADLSERTPLLHAAWNGHLPVVQELLSAGADPDTKDINKLTPLMAAALGGHTDIINLFLRMGSDVNAVDTFGQTSLMYVTHNNNAEAFQALIDAHANVHAVGLSGQTVLIHAAIHNNSNAIEKLINTKVNINARDNAGKTALDYAKGFNNRDIIDLLKQHGAKD